MTAKQCPHTHIFCERMACGGEEIERSASTSPSKYMDGPEAHLNDDRMDVWIALAIGSETHAYSTYRCGPHLHHCLYGKASDTSFCWPQCCLVVGMREADLPFTNKKPNNMRGIVNQCAPTWIAPESSRVDSVPILLDSGGFDAAAVSKQHLSLTREDQRRTTGVR